ncbi:MAG: hypothetical protein R3E01_06225 [Pirellulaceae bacterium]
MSWTFDLLFLAAESFKPLCEGATHSRDLAERFFIESGFGGRRCDTLILDDVLTLPRSQLAIGAYPSIVIVSDPMHYFGTFREPNMSRLSNIRTFRTTQILYVECAGVVNAFGYALLDSAGTVRRFAADAEHRVTANDGELFNEEKPVFRQSRRSSEDSIEFVIDDGAGRTGEVHEFELGDDLVFSVTARFFGIRYDQWTHDEPELTVFHVEQVDEQK